MGTKGILEKQGPENKKLEEALNESQHMTAKFMFKPNVMCLHVREYMKDIDTNLLLYCFIFYFISFYLFLTRSKIQF